MYVVRIVMVVINPAALGSAVVVFVKAHSMPTRIRNRKELLALRRHIK